MGATTLLTVKVTCLLPSFDEIDKLALNERKLDSFISLLKALLAKTQLTN
jgi:hypothetical protein